MGKEKEEINEALLKQQKDETKGWNNVQNWCRHKSSSITLHDCNSCALTYAYELATHLHFPYLCR